MPGADPPRRVRKLDPALRKITPDHSGQPAFRRIALTLRDDTQALRTTVQVAFVLLCIWIGIEFHLFVTWGMSGGASAHVDRPPGVEGFLPISALISLKYFVQTGILNNIHPSGFFVLLAILATGLLLKKAFCGWLCPIGTLSEYLWRAGEKLFGRTLRVPRWLDYPLRSLKYLLLLFFVSAIAGMSVQALQQFIDSPYNRVADIKMYLFFARIDAFATWTILVLAGLSLAIKNAWCRYLCPYGALLGALSMVSPVKVTRNTATCIDCNLCTKACPSAIAVHEATRVTSDECMACMRCEEACPVEDCLTMSLPTKRGTAVPGWAFGSLVVAVFVAVTGLAMLTGQWQNGISDAEYLQRFQELDSPIYEHNRGNVPEYGPRN